jgi:antitoxin component YwqK of YwqJK toxin-antitoxin module
MRRILAPIVLLTCLLILSPTVVLGEKLTFGDLEERNGLFYEKSSNVPFSGKVSGVLKGERWTRFSQGEFNKGKKNGPWNEYYDPDHLAVKGSYKDGVKDGLWISYSDIEPSIVTERGKFKNGHKEGKWIGKHVDGFPDYEGNYVRGVREGQWIEYERIKQTFVRSRWVGIYKNGEKVGLWTRYWGESDQKIWEAGVYKNSKREGLWKSYWSNGGDNNPLWETGKFKEGYKHGPWDSYHENGQLWESGKFDAGKRIGVWKIYAFDGSLRFEGEINQVKNGIKVDFWVEENSFSGYDWFEKGMYKNGQKEGIWSRQIIDDAEVYYYSVYKNGKHIRTLPENVSEKNIRNFE